MVRFAFLLLCARLMAQDTAILPQRPAFNGNDIVFSYSGGLWRVAKSGGSLTAPNFAFRNTTGAFDVENIGVAPDVESWNDPAAVRQGHHPQLEKAIAVAMEQWKQKPTPNPAEPVYPNYALPKAR